MSKYNKTTLHGIEGDIMEYIINYVQHFEEIFEQTKTIQEEIEDAKEEINTTYHNAECIIDQISDTKDLAASINTRGQEIEDRITQLEKNINGLTEALKDLIAYLGKPKQLNLRDKEEDPESILNIKDFLERINNESKNPPPSFATSSIAEDIFEVLFPAFTAASA
jgi:uncharacterized coiled-coil DUF342 family protein